MTAIDQELVDAVARYAKEALAPHLDAWEAAHGIPTEVRDSLADMGLFGMLGAESTGGLDLNFPTFIRIVEELGRYAGGISTILHVHNLGVSLLRQQFPDQHLQMQAEAVSGKRIMAFALSEPQAGSDTSSLTTRAHKDGDNWFINGTKHFITNGAICGAIVVVAVTDAQAGKDGVSAFVVPAENPGYSVIGTEKKLGQNVSDTCQVAFEDCRVPADALIGKEGSAYKVIMSELSTGRVSIAAQSVGFAQAALDLAQDYAQERRAFGKRIIDHQALAFRLADMAMQVDVARAYTHKAADMVEAGVPCAKEASIAKLFASEMAEKVCSDAIHVLGGAGYVEESGAARLYRDVRVCQIYEGTNDMQRMIIARCLGSVGM